MRLFPAQIFWLKYNMKENKVLMVKQLKKLEKYSAFLGIIFVVAAALITYVMVFVVYADD